MLKGARVIAIVPALDEEERIARVVETMPSFVDRIVVVDDASIDRTSAVARAATTLARVDVLRHARRGGVFAAIASGYRHALAERGGANDAFVVLAGDGQMDPNDALRVALPVVCGDVGYVKGNRFAVDRAAGMPMSRKLGGELFSRLTSLAIGAPVHDSQCGFTALARWACERIDLGAVWQGYGYPNDLLATRVRAHVPFT
ncbi:hypothetical protein BH09MYX1_BH09MYX1_48290 [soil metagenome]